MRGLQIQGPAEVALRWLSGPQAEQPLPTGQVQLVRVKVYSEVQLLPTGHGPRFRQTGEAQMQ